MSLQASVPFGTRSMMSECLSAAVTRPMTFGSLSLWTMPFMCFHSMASSTFRAELPNCKRPFSGLKSPPLDPGASNRTIPMWLTAITLPDVRAASRVAVKLYLSQCELKPTGPKRSSVACADPFRLNWSGNGSLADMRMASSSSHSMSFSWRKRCCDKKTLPADPRTPSSSPVMALSTSAPVTSLPADFRKSTPFSPMFAIWLLIDVTPLTDTFQLFRNSFCVKRMPFLIASALLVPNISISFFVSTSWQCEKSCREGTQRIVCPASLATIGITF